MHIMNNPSVCLFSSRTNDKRSMHELNKKLRAVSLAEQESNIRNQELLKTLGKVSKQATTLNNKTERLKKVRVRYFHSL